jgi:hypothetical protein
MVGMPFEPELIGWYIEEQLMPGRQKSGHWLATIRQRPGTFF